MGRVRCVRTVRARAGEGREDARDNRETGDGLLKNVYAVFRALRARRTGGEAEDDGFATGERAGAAARRGFVPTPYDLR